MTHHQKKQTHLTKYSLVCARAAEAEEERVMSELRLQQLIELLENERDTAHDMRAVLQKQVCECACAWPRGSLLCVCVCVCLGACACACA